MARGAPMMSRHGPARLARDPAALLLAARLAAYAAFVVTGLPSRAEVRELGAQDPGQDGAHEATGARGQGQGPTARRTQSLVPLSRISRNLIHAVIVSEDAKFFGHEGVDWDALKDSVEKNVEKRASRAAGAPSRSSSPRTCSSATHKSLTRKFRELIVTGWLEDDLTKRRILELYLNVIEWGDGVYGAEAAAQRYYGKPAADVDAQEAAGLAAMIPNPRRINPLVELGPARPRRRGACCG